MRIILTAIALTGAAFFVCLAANADELLPPVKIAAAGKPVDVQRSGHSAPFVGDFNGDGADDLLVGEFHEGRMRVYSNEATNSAPRFDKYEWFEAGGALATVSSS